MTPQPFLDFLHTIPVLIAEAPPVIGVSEHLQVKVVLQLDRQVKNIFIDSKLLQSPLNLHAKILEAIEDAQQFRERQVHAIISQYSYIANLSIWDVEGTLLAVKGQQANASLNVQGIGKNHLVLVVREPRGEIDRLVLNSTKLTNSNELERAIIEAARQGHEKITAMQKNWPFPELALI
jgi:DNA-binding protein YbaB